MSLRLALIDNYDSYTHNLVHLLATANKGHAPIVFRNDAYPSLSHLIAAHGRFDAFILSPGPGTPENPRDFPPLQTQILAANTPTLAVCLGHQALCYVYGAAIVHAPHGPRHGLLSSVFKSKHDSPILHALPSSFRVVRYHSLCVDPSSLPKCIIPLLWTRDNNTPVLMAAQHRTKPLFGLQFHPESVATQQGLSLATNFISLASALVTAHHVPRPMLKPIPSRMPSLRTLVRTHKLTLSPLTLFRSLYGKYKQAFWLDSSTATHSSSVHRYTQTSKESSNYNSDAQPARFSFMGAFEGPLSELVTYNVDKTVTTVTTINGKREHNISIFDFLEKALKERYAVKSPELPVEMNGGYVGFFGYELKLDSDVCIQNEHTSPLPDAWFIFADRLLLIDHLEEKIYFVSLVRSQVLPDYRDANEWFTKVSGVLDTIHSNKSSCDSAKQESMSRRHTLRFIPERSRSDYKSNIRQCLRYIQDGDSYEVCLTNRLRTKLPRDLKPDLLRIYSTLRLVNPAPYSAFLRLDANSAVCCSSPERYLHLSASGNAESKPIKGTLPRGHSLEDDKKLRIQLKESPKDRSENLMIVDLVRNDLSRTCEIGTVAVPKLMCVESFATVHQLVSTVTGKLTPSASAISCVRAAYPMGSMTGAPKIRTMEIIDSLETSARGIYSGSIGYLSVSGAVDLNVVIRTAVIIDSIVEIGVGGAIVAMSNPHDEYDETILKGAAIMKALSMNITGGSDYVVVHEPKEMKKRIKAEERIFG